MVAELVVVGTVAAGLVWWHGRRWHGRRLELSLSSRGREWAMVREVEDLLALVQAVEDRQRVIRVQASHHGSMARIYEEATGMTGDLTEIKARLSRSWERLYEAAQK